MDGYNLTVCYYHDADFDGVCSGAIVKRAMPDVKLVGVDYGKPFDWDTVEENVIMVDFMLEPFNDRMVRLINSSKVTWIDHHKSSIQHCRENMHLLKNSFYGLRKIGLAGCELTWSYFYGDKIPKAVTLLGRYDVWDLQYSKEVLPFQHGLRSIHGAYDPENELWDYLLHQDNPKVVEKRVRANRDYTFFDQAISKIVKRGLVVQDYTTIRNKQLMKSSAFEGKILGYNAIMLNSLFVSTSTFESMYDKTKHDIMLAFARLPTGKWTVSLRSTKIDVSEIAIKLGGGGHKAAAGFVTDKLFFLEEDKQ